MFANIGGVTIRREPTMKETPGRQRPAFRAARLTDVPAVVALVESAYRGDASRAGWTTEADLLDGQRVDVAGVGDIVARRNSRILLIEIDGALVGCSHLEKLGDTCHFGMFSVRPMRQGGGLGTQLIAEAERIARDEWSCARMEMTVISLREELIAWYERRGYSRTGRFKRFPYGDARFGIPRRDDLRFEFMVKELRCEM